MIPLIAYKSRKPQMRRIRRDGRFRLFQCSVLHWAALSLPYMVSMNCFRYAVAEHDTIRQPSADAAIDTDFFPDGVDDINEISQGENIILMSMHEIDPIEIQMMALDDDIKDDEGLHRQSDIAVDGIDTATFVADNYDAATEEAYSATVDGTIGHIPNDEHSDDANHGVYHTAEHSNDDHEENQMTDVPTVDIPTNTSVAGRTTEHSQDSTSTPTSSTTPTFVASSSMDTVSHVLTPLEMTNTSEDDRSLLDIFAESAKVYLTQQLVRRHKHVIDASFAFVN